MEDQTGQVGEQQAAKAGKYLTFKLDAEEFGLEILKVQEIIKMMDITKVPRTPARAHCLTAAAGARGVRADVCQAAARVLTRRLVLETRQFEALLGSVQPDGRLRVRAVARRRVAPVTAL